MGTEEPVPVLPSVTQANTHSICQGKPNAGGREAKPRGCPRLTSAMSLLGLEGLSPLKSSLLPLSPLSASPSLICSDSDTDLEDKTPSWKEQSELGDSRIFQETLLKHQLLQKPVSSHYSQNLLNLSRKGCSAFLEENNKIHTKFSALLTQGKGKNDTAYVYFFSKAKAKLFNASKNDFMGVF